MTELYNHRMQVFTTDGTFLATFGNTGGGNAEVNHPFAIAVDHAGIIYVTEGVGPAGARKFGFPLLIPFDIRPGSCPNPLNPKSRGVLPAAILGTEGFDVSMIDVSSLRLEGAAPKQSNLRDIATPAFDDDDCGCNTNGPDGFDDLLLKFRIQDMTIDINDPETKVLVLTGNLFDGTPVEARDCVVIVGIPEPPESNRHRSRVTAPPRNSPSP